VVVGGDGGGGGGGERGNGGVWRGYCAVEQTVSINVFETVKIKFYL